MPSSRFPFGWHRARCASRFPGIAFRSVLARSSDLRFAAIGPAPRCYPGRLVHYRAPVRPGSQCAPGLPLSRYRNRLWASPDNFTSSYLERPSAFREPAQICSAYIRACPSGALSDICYTVLFCFTGPAPDPSARYPPAPPISTSFRSDQLPGVIASHVRETLMIYQ